PHPKRNFVPTAVLTKSGQVPVNASKQSSHRAVVSIGAARHVNTVASKPSVNNAIYSYFKVHSPVRRPFNQKSVARTNNFNEKVNTAKVNNVTTPGPKAIVSAVEENRNNGVKSSACWIWRPKQNLIDHISKYNGSYTLKRFNYVDPQGRLKSDQGIIESGCFRHMTGNKFYLKDYQEINGEFVAFGENAKGDKITGKGKIRTGKLDFEDVYFVKELKFNLFSASQMCDKKNSVLFTDTKCVVLSPDFKLLDESQVLLKVPRNNNMYSFDLKNVVPVGGLTCLFSKATLDESNLWHRRLGHINFKTMNKLVRGNLVRGLPSKLFENDHTCVARQKGKQYKASYKTKTGIRREFSVARTPQQNGVAERKNKTLIEASRTMLLDFKLPSTFWAEAVNTACYVQNRVLVIKPHNKTPYKLFLGYSINSKAFRVFNTRTKIVEENLHINFLENKPNVARIRPNWMFDINTLIMSTNYQPDFAGNQTNGNAENESVSKTGAARSYPGRIPNEA
nr:ribonuclease H-like domain-containing protein [Tanacetum cinerariifolium]